MPREVFSTELLVQLQKWIANGNQIVLGIDMNEDVHKAQLSKELLQIGMKDIITSRHGNEGPATYADGSTVIDGIYAAASMQNCRCGFLPILFDHRPLWVEIPMDAVLGTNLAPTLRPQARRLKLEDPRIVNKFLDSYEKQHNNTSYSTWQQVYSTNPPQPTPNTITSTN